MKKKIIHISLIGILLILTGTGSFFWGKNGKLSDTLPNTTLPTGELTSVEAEEGFESKKIAVVNLDEGINKNGRVVNYASEISRYPSDDFYSTSLEDAKRGILTGDYGAYVVIPATFSENVESLNVKIQKAQIVYSVSNQLKSSVKLEVKEDINEYTKQLNQSVSYLYVDSILNEFQGAQSTIATVLSNNNQGNEALAMVEPADLLNFMNVTELKQPNAFVEAINIEEEMSKNSELLADMIAGYQAGLTDGQESVTNIVASGNELSQSVADIFAQVGSEKIGFDADNKFKYASEAEKTADNLATYLSDAADWVSAITGNITDEPPAIQTALDSANYYYKNEESRSPYDQQVVDLANFYADLSFQLDSSSLNSTVNNLTATSVLDATGMMQLVITDHLGNQVDSIPFQSGTINMDSSNPSATPEFFLRASDVCQVINKMNSYSTATVNPAPVINVSDASGNAVNMTDLDEHVARIMTNIPRYGAFEYVKDTKTDLMIKDSQDDAGLTRLESGLAASQVLQDLEPDSAKNPLNKTARAAEVKKVKSELITNIIEPLKAETDDFNSNLNTKASELTSRTTAYNQVVTSFDPFSYLDQTALQGNFSSMQENNSSISMKTAENSNKMSENLLDTYMIYTDNQLQLLKEVQTATEKGTDKVTEGLASAKDALGGLMDENYALLQPITTKLAYTKVGNVADKSVYQYIVSPITVSNQTDENKVTPAERRSKETEQKVAAQAVADKKTNGNNLVIPFVGGFLLLALVAIGISVVLFKNKKNTQKW